MSTERTGTGSRRRRVVRSCAGALRDEPQDDPVRIPLPGSGAELGHQIATTALLLGACLIAGCQSQSTTVVPVVPIEEARRVTAEFDDTDLTPPPRGIDDVLALVEKRTPAEPSCGIVTPSSDQQMRETIARLPEFEPWDGQLNKVNYPWGVAHYYFLNGDYIDAVRYMAWAERNIPFGHRGTRAWHDADLATYHAFAGDFDKAKSVASRASSAYLASRPYLSQRAVEAIGFRVERALGAAADARGELAAAEAHYRRARRILSGSNERVEVELARNLMRQGRLVEAENEARAAIRHALSHFYSSHGEHARNFAVLSEVLYEQGRYEDAEKLARAVAAYYEAICVTPATLNLAIARAVLAKALVARRQWVDALAVYETARTAMATDAASFDRLFGESVEWALALLRTGQVAQAEQRLQVALARAEKRLGADRYETAEIRGFLAMVWLAAGEREEARREFASATEILLRRRGDATDGISTLAARDRRLRMILEAYIGLLMQAPEAALEGRTATTAGAEAFRLAQVAGSQSVQRALARSSRRAALPDVELAKLARQEEDAGRRITALRLTRGQLLSRPSGGRNEAALRQLEELILTLRGARLALLQEIEQRYPAYASLVSSKPLSPAQVQHALGAHEVLIVTLVGEERSHV